MAIIKIKNKDYALYEELLLQRDYLRKEAHHFYLLYVETFGDLTTALFKTQIACIKNKKLINHYQRLINCGQAINCESINAIVSEELKSYQQQLETMIEENNAIKNLSQISEYDLLKIKKIYHKLVKQLHPDINPKTSSIPELMELWNAVTTAYQCNALADMEEAEVLVNQALERLNMDVMDIEIPDLSSKIEAVKESIKTIEETDPYQYRFILEDSLLTEEKKQHLKAQISYYENYEKELENIIKELLKRKDKTIWLMK